MNCNYYCNTFCTERPFPPLTVSIPKKNQADPLVIIKNGYGLKVSDTEVDLSNLNCSKHDNGEMVNYVISGIIFRKVSSKCGTHFKIFVKIGNSLFKSGKIVIVSCATFNRQRQVKQGLTPTSSIELLPYIGREYKKRLNNLGYTTIKDLALLHESLHKEGSVGIRRVWQMISNMGGLLTLDRFFKVVEISHNLCKSQVVTKRRRTVLPPLSSFNLPHF